MVVLCWPMPEIAYDLAKCVDLIPVREVDVRVDSRRTVGHPHDETNHRPVPESILGVMDPAAKDADGGGLPLDGRKELSYVGVRVRLLLFGFASHGIHGKKGAAGRRQPSAVLVDEARDLGPVFAIADAGTKNHPVQAVQVDLAVGRQREEHGLKPLLPDPLNQAIAYLDRVSIHC